jgi:hypothetical protein
MTLIDDFMRKTEDGLKTLKETADDIAFNVEKQAKIARKKMEIMKIQRRIQKIYSEIGEYVYGEHAMNRPITMESPFLSDRMVSVSQLKREVQLVEDEIAEMRATQAPEPKQPPEAGESRGE